MQRISKVLMLGEKELSNELANFIWELRGLRRSYREIAHSRSLQRGY